MSIFSSSNRKTCTPQHTCNFLVSTISSSMVFFTVSNSALYYFLFFYLSKWVFFLFGIWLLKNKIITLIKRNHQTPSFSTICLCVKLIYTKLTILISNSMQIITVKMKNQNQYLTLKIGQGQNYYNKIMFFSILMKSALIPFKKYFVM